jgi:hypothetical protein
LPIPRGINYLDALRKLLVEGRGAVSDVPPDTVYSSPLMASSPYVTKV